MIIQAAIEEKLQALEPAVVEVLNESHMHSVPPNSETHFKVTLVSGEFNGTMKVKRHQLIYKVLAEELAGPVHALALHLYTPEEWANTGQATPDSPNCMGGSKGDARVVPKGDRDCSIAVGQLQRLSLLLHAQIGDVEADLVDVPPVPQQALGQDEHVVEEEDAAVLLDVVRELGRPASDHDSILPPVAVQEP